MNFETSMIQLTISLYFQAMTESEEARRKVASMLENHEWIADDRKFFGQVKKITSFDLLLIVFRESMLLTFIDS